MNRKLIIILGPTAVGKTDYSIEMALRYAPYGMGGRH